MRAMGASRNPHDHERLHARTADHAVDAAVRALRERGERVTAPRKAVLEALAGRSDHLTADEVSALLEGTDVHRATVYRTLDVLAAAGVVSHRHGAGGATRYHLAAVAEGAEHLHGHCRSCGVVVVLPADALDDAAVRLHDSVGFSLEAEQCTLVGLCADCAARASA